MYYSVRCSPAKPRQCSTCSEGAEQACIKHPCTQDLSSSPTGLYIYIYIYIYFFFFAE